jgi:phage portal protein BeeE
LNLLSRLLKPGQEIERFNISQYLQQIVEQGSYFTLQQSFYAPAISYSQGQPTERIENSYRGYVYGAYKINPIVYGLMKRRSSLFSEARFMWRKIAQGQPGDLFWNRDLALLETPWPNGTTGELLTRMIQDVDLAGNAYVVNEGDRLRRLRPDWTQIILSGNPLTDPDIDVMGYVYTPNGPEGNNSQTYHPDEICHWSPEPDPDATYRGMSWLTPVVREIQGDNATTDHKNNFFRNGATFGPIVKAPPGMTRKQFEEFIEASEAQHTGKDMAYKTMYLAGGSDVELIRHDFHQLDFASTVGKAETRMCVAAGVPAAIAGVSEGLQGSSLNAGNYGAAKRDFVDATMRPLWRSACAALASIITAPANGELWYDEADIAYLHEDAQDVANINQVRMATILQGVNSGFDPDGVVKSVAPQWSKTMPHSGLMSVQLQPPGAPGEPDAQQAAAEESGAADQGFGDGSTPSGDEGDDGFEPYPPDSSRAVSLLVDDILRAMVEVDDDLVDEFDDDDLERAYNSAEARIAKGHKGAGQFGSRVTEAIEQHIKGGGKDQTVLSGLSRPSLVAHAKSQGLNPAPRMKRDQLEAAILEHARNMHAAGPAHKSFSITHAGKTVKVGVYTNPKTGKFGVYQETNGKKSGRALFQGADLAAVQAWAGKNGHTELAKYAQDQQGPSAAASSPEAEKIASAFHEDWRKTRLLADGSHEPRAKTTTDQAWIAKHGTDQVDIANTRYADLPKDWQAENKAAADVVAGILARHGGTVDLNDPKTREQVGEEIHQAWLSRPNNAYAKGGKLDVPFAQLPADEQDKDLDQVTVALKALGKSPAPKPATKRAKWNVSTSKSLGIRTHTATSGAPGTPGLLHGHVTEFLPSKPGEKSKFRAYRGLAGGVENFDNLADAKAFVLSDATAKRSVDFDPDFVERKFDPSELRIPNGPHHGEWTKGIGGKLSRLFKGKGDTAGARDASDFKDREQRKGLGLYATFGTAVNAMLRRGQTSEQQFHDDRGERAVRSMDAAFADPASRLGEDIRVSRGVSNAATTWGGAFDREGDNTGLTWDDPGYVSTTTSDAVAERFAKHGAGIPDDPREARYLGYPVVMHIHVPAGTPAIGFNSGGHTESEVALPRGYRYRVVKDHGPNTYPRVVDVEIVGPGG